MSDEYLDDRPGEPCEVCGQYDVGQTGEYPCEECGLPLVWDAERGGGVGMVDRGGASVLK